MSKASDPRRHSDTLAGLAAALGSKATAKRAAFRRLIDDAETRSAFAKTANQERFDPKESANWRQIVPVLRSAIETAEEIAALLDEQRDTWSRYEKAAAYAARLDAAERDEGQEAEAREAEARAKAERAAARQRREAEESAERDRVKRLTEAEREAEKRLAELGGISR